VKVSFYYDTGQPLALDFGQGASATLNLTVPAGGIKSVTSSGGSTPAILSAWAIATSDTPVTGVVLYRATQNGTPLWDVAAVGTGSAFYYNSYANANLGIAVGNPNSQPVRLQLTALDENGVSRGVYTLNLNPLSHTAFNLFEKITGLPPGFAGSITITPTDDPLLPFVAWSVNYREGLLSPLPPGEMISPGPYNRRPNHVATLVKQAAAAMLQDAEVYLLGEDPELLGGYIRGMSVVIDTDAGIKASYSPIDGNVHLSQGLVEVLGSSDAALGFVIVHMGVHGMFTYTGPPDIGPFANDVEGAADAAAELSLLKAGLDPYGGSDFYSRLLYATVQNLNVDNPLRAEFGLPSGVPGRLQKLWTSVQSACAASAGLADICRKARKYWHPHNPATVP
jgi:hypothetical protein